MKNSLVASFAPEVVSQLRNYGKLMRIDKPIGTWLLLWPTLWALWLAGDAVWLAVRPRHRGAEVDPEAEQLLAAVLPDDAVYLGQA